MEKVLIGRILNEIRHKIDYLQSSTLRAESIKKLLEIEYKNNKNIDLISATQKGLVEMLSEIDKTQLLQEIEFAINLLENFITHNKFTLKTIPLNKDSIKMSERYDVIKNMMIELVKSKEENETHGFID